MRRVARRWFCVAVFVLAATGLHPPAHGLTRPAIDFAERVRAQTVIERVYYGHQIGATRPFEEAVPRGVIERKVRTYLRQSSALDRFWKTPVTAEALDRELQRIAAQTRFPERLREIYRALGDDPVLVRECFARPILVERLVRNFRGEAYDAWWAEVEPTIETAAPPLPHTTAALPQPARRPGPGAAPACSPASAWEEGSLGTPPNGRFRHSAVWTGNVMIVWGGPDNSGGLYDPLTDTWTATSRLGAPILGEGHAAVWTGSRMLVWGGGELRSGGQYDPAADLWTPMSLVGAPPAAMFPSAVWTGSRMIVWGGLDPALGVLLSTGGVYDPAADTWTPTSQDSAPGPRWAHAAIWTGSRMLVWGGEDMTTGLLGDGALYDQANDTWSPMSGLEAPSPRYAAGVVWTGSVVVIWGGNDDGGPTGTGGRYDPATDTWAEVSDVGSPEARGGHATVWTGSQMLVWGGDHGNFLPVGGGGSYDPGADAWTSITTTGAPSERVGPTGVWAGGRMIVWGGYDGTYVNTGGRYDPASDTWTPTATLDVPTQRYNHTAVWTGTRLIVWGGHTGRIDLNSGGRYDPLTDTWTPTSLVNAPSPRTEHTVVWTGSRMVVWGGIADYDIGAAKYPVLGGRYDPIQDLWTPTSVTGAPSGRNRHTAVWSGSRMVVWGGVAAGASAPGGGRYDPIQDTWSPVSTVSAPSARSRHTAVWTGNLMVIWGGIGPGVVLNTGARYDPTTDTWSATTLTGAPGVRYIHTAVWTGSRMLIWGGAGSSIDPLGDGASYDPVGNAWTTMSATGSPSARYSHGAVWAGDRMLLWGGHGPPFPPPTAGGQYFPASDAWAPITSTGSPPFRGSHTTVWTGESMVVWGGFGSAIYSTGSRYIPSLSIADVDADGAADCADNCPSIANPAQADADFDGAGDVCDCAPADAGVTLSPDASILTLLGDGVTLRWSNSGPSTVRRVARGLVGELPVGIGSSETCIEPALGGSSTTDPAVPQPGTAFWYHSSETNACGSGTYGTASDGTPRITSACP